MTAAVLPKFTPRLLSSALRMIRSGATSPSAISGYTVAEEFPRFDTHTSLFFRSSATPVGLRSRVDGPWITRAGATSPLRLRAHCAKTRTDWPMSFATYRSPLSGLYFIAAGQSSCVLSPVITRSGLASPFASSA